ncbi:MAG: hypothetical protein AB7K08_13260 [Microbacteriaceae bacterium]
MPEWIVNTQAQPGSNDHEVHRLDTCTHLPDSNHRLALGWYATCQEAVKKAKDTYSDSNGCFYCAYACHTT